MHRGTTPLHEFRLPKNMRKLNIVEAFITYSQNETTVLEKTLDNGTFIESGVIYVGITQEESLLFDETQNVEIQARLKDSDGGVYASYILTIPVYKILKEGII